MRIAVVAGPDPGHVFPAMALCRRFQEAGDSATLFTGERWLGHARQRGIAALELPGLALPAGIADNDAGRRIHERAAVMSTLVLKDMNQLMPDLVVSDVITVAGGLAAERLGIPWIELSPHPLYLPSRGLPPIGSGLAPGTGLFGTARDVALRALVSRDWRKGKRQRARVRASLGLPVRDPGPLGRLIATLPALELPRPDWPANAFVVGPLVWEPAHEELRLPAGDAPVIAVSPSTASQGGAPGVLEAVVEGVGRASPPRFRVAATMLRNPPTGLPPWVSAGPGRQDVLLSQASVLVCGAGHGIISRGLLAGLPLVVVPGGGDQRELASRVVRLGVGLSVRPGRDGRPDAAEMADAINEVRENDGYAAAAQGAAQSLAAAHDVVGVVRDLVAQRNR